MAASVALHAQFTYTTNADGVSVTITGYTGFSNNVAIPGTLDGLSVVSIGTNAFEGMSITNVTIPDSVTNIGNSAFYDCMDLYSVAIGNGVISIGESAFSGEDSDFGYYEYSIGCPLTSVTIPDSVVIIGAGAFYGCNSLTNVIFGNSVASIGISAFSGEWNTYDGDNPPDSVPKGCPLTSVTIPNSVTNIESDAFFGCTSLTNITIGSGVTVLGYDVFQFCSSLASVTIPITVTGLVYSAFANCSGLKAVYFEGNAPGADSTVFQGDNNVTVYYLPGTTGWSSTFDGVPTALWTLPYPIILTSGANFGAQSNGFSFNISWATNISVVVEASTNLAGGVWLPLQTNTLTNGSYYFNDSDFALYPRRYYRVTTP
jgi:hypothetical protein